MHDAPQGPGWWQSDDGRWYPPKLVAPRDMSWARLQAAPGWYPDTEPGWYRWWDGGRWTGHRRATDLRTEPFGSAAGGRVAVGGARMRYRGPADRSGRGRPLLAPLLGSSAASRGGVVIGFIGLLAVGALALSSAGGRAPADIVAGGVPDPTITDEVEPGEDPGAAVLSSATTTIPSNGLRPTDAHALAGGDATAAEAADAAEAVEVRGRPPSNPIETPVPSLDPTTTTVALPPPSKAGPDPVGDESVLQESAPALTALATEPSTIPSPPSEMVVGLIPSAPADRPCHPAYSPCIEHHPGDALNCGDLRPDQKPVTVHDPSDDPYGLDGNGDGTGCEPG